MKAITSGTSCLVLLAALWAYGANQEKPDHESIVLESSKVLSFQELAKEAAKKHLTYLPILDRPTLSVGIYRLPKGGKDLQEPHGRDEVYYVVKGRAQFEARGEREKVEPGSVIFVAAKAEHKFVEIEEALEVLVFFTAAAPVEEQHAEQKHEHEHEHEHDGEH